MNPFAKKWTLFCLSATLTLACTHVGSGRYVRLGEGEDLDRLSGMYDIPPALILAANKGRRPASGQWYFIPLERGIMGSGMRNYADDITASYLESGDLIWPVPASKRISSRFGKRWGKNHHGIDIPAREGSAVIATANGRVVYSGSGLGGYGNLVVVSHPKYGLFSVYAHNQRNYVSKGDRVYKGQVIAKVGMTGRTTGAHLHFELRKNSRSLDPVKYVYKKW